MKSKLSHYYSINQYQLDSGNGAVINLQPLSPDLDEVVFSITQDDIFSVSYIMFKIDTIKKFPNINTQKHQSKLKSKTLEKQPQHRRKNYNYKQIVPTMFTKKFNCYGATFKERKTCVQFYKQ